MNIAVYIKNMARHILEKIYHKCFVVYEKYKM